MPDADFHKQYDRFANGSVQTGELPPWMHVHGRVAWYVAQGPYSKLGEMWQEFMKNVQASKLPVMGPPGDVYLCDPKDHPGESERKIITIIWAPMKG